MGGKKRGKKKELAVASSGDETVLFVQAGQTLAGRYHLQEALARGAMGIVFLAEDKQLDGMEVAVKVLPAEMASNLRAQKRLQKEAMAAMALNHPNIVNVRDYQLVDNVAFLVMELLSGPTVDDELAEKETLPPEQVKDVAQQVGQALSFAHEHKVIHRDIKPTNLMYHQDGDKKIVKLTDFGIAYEVKDTITRLTGVESGGTLNYVAPEQLEGELPCEHSDQYSLAATLYELLAGRPPFSGAGLSHQILNASPKTIDGVPQEMNVALLKALSKKPTERFSSVDAFVKAFCQEKAAAKSLGAKGEMGVVDNSKPLRTIELREKSIQQEDDYGRYIIFFLGLALILYVVLHALSEGARPRHLRRVTKAATRRSGPAIDEKSRQRATAFSETTAKAEVKKARCRFKSNPPGAKVYCVELGKLKIGTTKGSGFDYEFKPGTYTFSFVKSNYFKKKVTRTFFAGKQYDVTAYLQVVTPPSSPTRQTALLPAPKPSPKPRPKTPRYEFREFGPVKSSHGAKTFSFNVPSTYKRVLVSLTHGNKTKFNPYAGWSAWMKLNGNYAWRFLGYDTKRGSYVNDSVLGKKVYSNDYEGKWMDITNKVKSGQNKLTYYHFTKGGGFYIQVKIYF